MEKRNRTKTKKITYKMQANLLLAFGAIIVLLIILICVVIKINVKDGSKYAKKVLTQQSYTSTELAYKRGDILDSNGVVMATSIKVYNLAIDPKFILTQNNGEYLYKDSVIKVLTDYFEYDEDEINTILNEKSSLQYCVLQEKVDSDIVDGFKDYVEKYQKDNNAIVKGIWFEEQYERQYPLSSVASSVIGFTYDLNAGNWGIEGQYNDELNGTTGRSYGYYDSELNLERTVKEATDGNTVVSTIDSNIQQIVEKHIEKFQKDTGSNNTAVVIANPNNGEILAMASSDGIYDLNNPRDLSSWYSEKDIKKMSNSEKLEKLNAIWRNYCISDSYEPGSTYKPFVVAAALEEGTAKDGQMYYCDGKETIVKGTKPIRCAKRSGHGSITLGQSLMYSCNDALMAIGMGLGKDLFAKYQTNFGFGQKTGIDLMGESTGIVYSAEQLNPLELATSSFGQGLNVTMVQMVAAFSSVVNGGYYYQPHVVKELLNENGAVIKNFEPVVEKQLISNDTSSKIVGYLKDTVEDGTATKAQVEGYSIGGKTGTAQKLPRSEGKYLVSFIGVAPCENPQFVIYTIVDEPNVDNQAQSGFAQQLSADIMKEIFPFMGITPSTKVKDDNKKPTTSSKPNKEDGSKNDDDDDEDEDVVDPEEQKKESNYDYDSLDNDNEDGIKEIIDENGKQGDVNESSENPISSHD